MARYIDADELIAGGWHLERHAPNGRRLTMMSIADVPTADVVEVKRAKWEINSDGYYPYCSNCYTEPKNGVMSKRCPECGAYMDGGNTE